MTIEQSSYDEQIPADDVAMSVDNVLLQLQRLNKAAGEAHENSIEMQNGSDLNARARAPGLEQKSKDYLHRRDEFPIRYAAHYASSLAEETEAYLRGINENNQNDDSATE